MQQMPMRQQHISQRACENSKPSSMKDEEWGLESYIQLGSVIRESVEVLGKAWN